MDIYLRQARSSFTDRFQQSLQKTKFIYSNLHKLNQQEQSTGRQTDVQSFSVCQPWNPPRWRLSKKLHNSISPWLVPLQSGLSFCEKTVGEQPACLLAAIKWDGNSNRVFRQMEPGVVATDNHFYWREQIKTFHPFPLALSSSFRESFLFLLVHRIRGMFRNFFLRVDEGESSILSSFPINRLGGATCPCLLLPSFWDRGLQNCLEQQDLNAIIPVEDPSPPMPWSTSTMPLENCHWRALASFNVLPDDFWPL